MTAMRPFPAIDRLSKDAIYTLRSLSRSPGFTAVAVLSVALARLIRREERAATRPAHRNAPLNTAVFTVADPVLVRRLPVDNPEELVLFRMSDPDEADTWSDTVTYPLFERMMGGTRSTSGAFMIDGTFQSPLTREGTTPSDSLPQIEVAPVSGNYFETLGVRAVAGRTISDTDDRPDSDPVVVIGYGLWITRFGGNPDVIGSRVAIGIPLLEENVDFTVIGVAPKGFYGVDIDVNPDMWLPYHVFAQLNPAIRILMRFIPDGLGVRMMARLRPEATLRELQSEVDVIQAQTGEGESADVPRVRVEGGQSGFSLLRLEFFRPLVLLSIAVASVLLIACANVAALTIVRGLGRRKELALRIALGCNRFGIYRQLLLESVLVGGAGASLGLGFSYWSTRLLIGYLPPETGFIERAGLDIRVLTFTGGVALLSVLIFGLVPALRISNPDLVRTLNVPAGRFERGGRATVFIRLMVIAQIGISLVLLIGTGLFVRTIQNLREVDLGFDRDVVQFSIEVDSAERIDDWSGSVERVLGQLELTPNVESATHYNQRGLLGGRTFLRPVSAPGSGAAVRSDSLLVGPRFFETMGVSILSGREFQSGDESRESDSPVAVISQALAIDLFGNRNPVGRRIHQNPEEENSEEVEIIGVAEDVRHSTPREYSAPALYRLFLPSGGSTITRFAFRSRGNDGSRLAIAQRAAGDIDSRFRVARLMTMNEIAEASLVREKFMGRMVGLFGGLALSLTVVGIYGLMSYLVSQRTREIGIRMALGARRRQVMEPVFREVWALCAVGVVLGLLSMAAMTRVAASVLFGVTTTDAWVTIGAVAILVLSATVAGYIPARRAARMTAHTLLRCD